MKETWKTIQGYDGKYKISNLGRIKSFKNKEPRILKQSTDNKGYLYVCLSHLGITGNRTAHRLVGFAFLGLTDSLTINHKDLNKQNNTVENLECMSATENIRHAAKNLVFSGERNSNCKLKKSQINKIRKLYKTGNYTHRKLGKIFNISHAQITDIINFKSRKYQ